MRTLPILLLLLAACTADLKPEAEFRSIELPVLEDKIRGGWAGQMIGVSYGAPTEFGYQGRIIPLEELPVWSPERVGGALDQDDLYVDITMAQVLDERGLDAPIEAFGAALRDAGYSLWHANLAARRALRRGVPARASGAPEHNVHANDIDFQIESDFIGLMTPGMPQAAAEVCSRVGRVMNRGDGLYGGIFVSAMYSAAFFDTDPRRIVEAGLASLPAESPYARVIADVLAWSASYPDDWTAVWQLLEEHWNGREACPEGALAPFNIDAKLNGAYVALGLLYGEGDLGRTLEVATRAGQDSDCNPSTAAGILGVVLGYEGLPLEYTSGIESIAGETFRFTEHSLRSIVASTVRRAVEMTERNGGYLEEEVLQVPLQAAASPPLEVWDDYGAAAEFFAYDDPRWTLEGEWAEKTVSKWGGEHVSLASDATGARATIRFRGTGAILTGWYLATGGKAEVHLDGSPVATVDVYPDESDVKFSESIWHRLDLEDGEHELLLIVQGEAHPDSDGAEIALSGLTVFRGGGPLTGEAVESR